MEAILPFGFMGMSPSRDTASDLVSGSSVKDAPAAGTKCSPLRYWGSTRASLPTRATLTTSKDDPPVEILDRPCVFLGVHVEPLYGSLNFVPGMPVLLLPQGQHRTIRLPWNLRVLQDLI